MDAAALKDGGKTLATEVAKETKAEAVSERRKEGIEISGSESPNVKDDSKTQQAQKEQKTEFVLGI